MTFTHRPSTADRSNVSLLLCAVVLSALTLPAQAQTAGTDTQLSILTPPSVSVCTPVSVQWSNAAPGDVYVSVHKSSDPYGPSIKDFPAMDGSTGKFTWTVDIPADETVVLRITDQSGLSNSSGFIPVRPGTSTDCLNKSGANNVQAANNTGKPPATTGTSTNLPVPQSNSNPASTSSGSSGTTPSGTSAANASSTSPTSGTSSTVTNTTSAAGSKPNGSAATYAVRHESALLSTDLMTLIAIALVAFFFSAT